MGRPCDSAGSDPSPCDAILTNYSVAAFVPADRTRIHVPLSLAFPQPSPAPAGLAAPYRGAP